MIASTAAFVIPLLVFVNVWKASKEPIVRMNVQLEHMDTSVKKLVHARMVEPVTRKMVLVNVARIITVIYVKILAVPKVNSAIIVFKLVNVIP